MISQLSFPHDYEVSILNELPENQDLFDTYYYPYGAPTPTLRGLRFMVNPGAGAKPWIGVAAFKSKFPNTEATGIYACPNPSEFCVVTDGHAVILDSGNPTLWTNVPRVPVLDVKLLLEHQMMIFIDNARISAWGKSGLIWTTRPLALNGVRLIHADDQLIYGEAEAANGCIRSFQTDLQTGRCTGGCWPLEATISISEMSKSVLASWFERNTQTQPVARSSQKKSGKSALSSKRLFPTKATSADNQRISLH
jgi:hypothetical protein